MKHKLLRRLGSLVLTAALLGSLIVAPAHAVVENTTAVTDSCPCGCGKTLEQVSWKSYAGTASNGHFYLNGDYTQDGQQIVISGDKMVLDLRGHTITTTDRTRLFLVNGYLAVLDSVGGGRLSARTPSTTGDYGGVVQIMDNETTGSTFELYSGTITPASASESGRYGGLVSVGSGGTFRMHDGMLLKGSAVGNGGGIYTENSTSTVELLGGSIVDCKATANGGSIYGVGTVTIKNCKLLRGIANGGNGGNIYMLGGTLTIENAVLANGYANPGSSNVYGGGNISAISGTKITVSDSRIYGGFTTSNGGNLGLGYSTSVLTNCTITGGVSGKKGNNIAMPHASSKVTLDGCTVDGGMDNVIGTLILKGATKIALTSGGLDLTEQTSKTTTATALTEGAEVYVSGSKTLTGSLDYIKPALRTVLTASDTTITAAQAADGEVAGYCPCCSAQVAWQPYGTEGATHVYLTANMTDFAEATLESNLTIDLCGYDITATGRAFNIPAGAALTVIDSAGAGVITGSGTDAEAGGVFYNAGTLKLYGGKYTYAAADGVTVAGGGVVYNAGTLDITGGYLTASAFSNTASGARGGVIYMADTAAVTLTVNGARMVGGSAYSGGTVFVGYNNVVNLNYATMTSGSATTYGGNVVTTGSATNNAGVFNATGSVFASGKASGDYGGNLQLNRFSGTFTDCYVTGGSGAKYGGNMNIGGSTDITFKDSIIYGGTSTSRGGNVYLSNNDSKVKFQDCLISGGSSVNGGNLYPNNGTASIVGGQILWGTASTNGGNIYVLTDDSTGVTVKANTSGTVPVICGGTAAGKGGNIYAAGIMTLTDAKIALGAATAGNDLYLCDDENLALIAGTGVTGDIRMNADAALLTENVYGGAISGITSQAADAVFVLDGTYGECGTTVEDGVLYVALASVVDQSGNAVWYAANADAVAACTDGSFVKLFTDSDLELTKDLYVDLNGHTVNISGSYTLYGMDSSGDGYTEPAGKAILTDTTAAEVTYAPNGNTYFGITDGDSVTCHRLGMAITGVSIRPSENGMYYTAKWSCDDTLKAQVGTYGIVASTEDMPDADFTADEGNLWTTFAQETFESGAAKTGAVISGILKTEDRTAEQNDEYGRKPVYAKAYITLNGKTYISQDRIGFSLYNLMRNLDRLIMEKPIQYRKQNLKARNFYETWKDNGMGGWELSKIPDPGEDDVVDVLMVGHSFCYYYVEELYNMAKAAGIKMRVCNLYRSSHKLVQYYENWIDGVSYYQLFEVSDDTGGDRVAYSNMSLESALAQYEWDFIALQERTTETIAEGAETHYESTKLYWETLLDYFIEQFPNAQIGWHQTWTNQAGDYAKSSSQTAEKQASGALIMETYATMICDYYNEPAGETVIARIPTGRAWQIMRTDNAYDNMCCRLGYDSNVSEEMHGGDGSHDGDIGGGQYLNACVWFEVITGQSCVGNTYKPDYKTSSTISDTLFSQLNVEKTDIGYTLTDDFVATLQAAAHAAVAEMTATSE